MLRNLLRRFFKTEKPENQTKLIVAPHEVDRRAFLQFFGVSTLAVAADPEVLLWKPDSKLISIPSVVRYSAVMGNRFLTRQEITYEALLILQKNLSMLPNVYRDFDREFRSNSPKIGHTIHVRKPHRFIVQG